MIKLSKILPYVIGIILFFLPFFWFSNGQIDWGGDSTRVYFLDPIAYFMNHTLYGVSPSDIGGQLVSFYSLPNVLLLAFLRHFLSPTIVVALFHGIKLSCSFIFVFLIVKEILLKEFNKKSFAIYTSAILSGLMYTFSPISIIGWDKVIWTHDQFFLNPLMFFLLLRYILTKRFLYLLVAILISLIYSHNFSFGAAPPIVAFYSLSIIFLVGYAILVLRTSINWKQILVAFGLFIFVHAFHLIPLALQIFQFGSDSNDTIFSESAKLDRGLSYFLAIVLEVKLVRSILLLPQLGLSSISNHFTLVMPLTILMALMIKKSKLLILTVFIFLISLYFVSANITSIGVEVYKMLFSLPGFSMFRNFYGQWGFVYIFYYCILMGISGAIVMRKVGPKFSIFATLIIVLFILTNATQFILGKSVDKTIWLSRDVRILSEPDPSFLQALDYVGKLPVDGKVLTFPLTDPGYQISLGKNGGAYQGPSLIGYLSGKRDFGGLQSFGVYTETLKQAVKNNDIDLMLKIFSYNNIKYIFYNSDPKIYEEGFPSFPYIDVRNYFPADQKGYGKLIKKLHAQNIADFGMNYHIYSLSGTSYLPHFYVGSQIVETNDFASAFTMTDSSTKDKVIIQKNNELDLKGQRIFKAYADNPFEYLVNNLHLHTHKPHVSKKPDDVLYYLVLIKEEMLANSMKNLFSRVVDNNMYLVAKRVFELEYFGNDMHISPQLGIFNKIFKTPDYMSWDSNITRIENRFMDTITYLNSQNINDGESNAEKIKINEQIKKQQSSLTTIVFKSNKSLSEKKELHKKIDSMFIRIRQRLDVPIILPSSNRYSIELPLENEGIYELLIEKRDSLSEESANGTLEINSEKYDLIDGLDDGDYIKFQNLKLHGNIKEMSLVYPRKNLLTNSEQFDLDLEKIKTLKDIKIEKLKPSSQYSITFEYKTSGEGYFSFSFLDTKNIKGEEFQRNRYFFNYLHSSQWKKEQTLLVTDSNMKEGFISFQLIDGMTTQGTISIKDIRVEEVITPKVILLKNETTVVTKPTVTFQKINPMRYDLRIENASTPFVLVFSDSYNKDWKFFKSEGSNMVNKKIVSSFEGGKIMELDHTNNFFNIDFLKTFFKTPFVDNAHFMANGYANAWYMQPKDFGNAKVIHLTLENTSQRKFYVGLAFSLVSVCVLIVLLIKNIFK